MALIELPAFILNFIAKLNHAMKFLFIRPYFFMRRAEEWFCFVVLLILYSKTTRVILQLGERKGEKKISSVTFTLDSELNFKVWKSDSLHNFCKCSTITIVLTMSKVYFSNSAYRVFFSAASRLKCQKSVCVAPLLLFHCFFFFACVTLSRDSENYWQLTPQ